MWYVMQVRTGTEESICRQCRNIIGSEVLERCFIPYYEEKKRYKGRWHTQEKILFPGYVFMITDKIEELSLWLRQVIGLTKLLGTGQEIVPLTADEERWLLRLGGSKQKVEISEGIIEAGNLRITNGPLTGMEESIKRIDRHKRKAYLEVEMFGRMVEVQVGLEVVEKS